MTRHTKKMTFIQKDRGAQMVGEFAESLSLAVDIINDGLWVWDLDNAHYYFSPGFYRMLSYEPQDLAPSYEIWRELIHPQEREAITRRIKDLHMTENSAMELEYRMKSKSGAYRWILSRIKVVERDKQGSPLRIVGSNIDITERKRAIKALRESEERYRNLYERSPLMYQSIDKGGYIIDVNSTWLSALGFTPREAIARWFGDFLAFRYRQQLHSDIKKLCENGKLKNIRYEMQGKDKKRLFVELNARVTYDKQDNFIQAHCIIIDITNHMENENSLRKLTERLRVEQKALTEKNIALQQVLAHISQERKKYRKNLGAKIDENIGPALTAIKQKVSQNIRDEINEIVSNLNAIIEKDIDPFLQQFSTLTPREMEMCYLIGEGQSSKEISAEFNLSVVTVHKHREQIRKKLGLSNKRINLITYLKSRLQLIIEEDRLIDDIELEK